jgi:hypothetical protein
MSGPRMGLPTAAADDLELGAVTEPGVASASLGQPFGVGGLGATAGPTATILMFSTGWRDHPGRRAARARAGGQTRAGAEPSPIGADRAAVATTRADRDARLARGESDRGPWSARLAPWRIRTLRYIAAHPGAGSREIAASGTGSCGCDASALLRRMEELDFVENVPRSGAPRAWHITVHGQLAVSAAERPRSHLVAV